LSDVARKTLSVVADAAEREVERRFPPKRRPPGAEPEAAFLADCTRCGACAEACPHDAIHHFGSDTEALAGTPVMVPESRACHQCEAFPCAAACPEPALAVPSTTTWKLGEARIVEERCIAWNGPECGACISACPADAPALRLENWRPVLDPVLCVGCGLCIERCPTLPKAIVLDPLGDS
jgi:ferredoxin